MRGFAAFLLSFVKPSGEPVSWSRSVRCMLALGCPTLFGIYAGNADLALIATVCALWVWLNDLGGTVTDRLLDMMATAIGVLSGGVLGGLAGAHFWPELIGLFLCSAGIGWLHNTSRALENAVRCAGFAYVIAASLGLTDPRLILAASGGCLWAIVIVCGDQLLWPRVVRATGTSLRAGLARLNKGHAPDWRFGVRYALAATAALIVAIQLGASHAAWATITTLAVMRPNDAESVTLVIERGIGTFVGVGVASAILAITQNPWALGLLVAVLAFTISPSAVWHRWTRFAAITATVLVLLDLALLNQGGDRPLLVERIYDTGLGCSIALLATWAIFPTRWRVPVV